MRFKDKVVWITGASSGIGEGLAYGFSAEGATLILSARRRAELERVKAACANPDAVHVVPFDMTDMDAIPAATDVTLAAAGRIDILINNAGVSQRALAEDTDLAVDRRIMEIDYFGPIALTKAVLPHMIAQKSGHLVVTSSVAGKYGVPMRSAYAAAKHALHGYFDTLRVEIKRHHIDVTLLVIAGVKSNVSVKALTADGSEFGKEDWLGVSGLAPADCARTVLAGLAAKEEEIEIGYGPPMAALWLKRYAPNLLTRRMSRIPLPEK